MTSYAKFIIAESGNTITLPLSAIQNDGEGSFVIQEDGSKKTVSTGLTDGKKVEILSGIQEGDTIRIDEK